MNNEILKALGPTGNVFTIEFYCGLKNNNTCDKKVSGLLFKVFLSQTL